MENKLKRKEKFFYQLNYDSLSGLTPDNKRGSIFFEKVISLSQSEIIYKIEHSLGFYLCAEVLYSGRTSKYDSSSVYTGFDNTPLNMDIWQNNILSFNTYNNQLAINENLTLLNSMTVDTIVDKFGNSNMRVNMPNIYSLSQNNTKYSLDVNIETTAKSLYPVLFNINSRLFPNGSIPSQIFGTLNYALYTAPYLTSLNLLTFYIGEKNA